MAKSEKTADADLNIVDEVYGVVENLAAIEEHFMRSMGKTGNKNYGTMAAELSKVRGKIQKIIWPYGREDGELWCIGKHLPVTSMRLMESAVKYCRIGDNETALELMGEASDIKGLFIELRRMKMEEKNGSSR